MSTKIQDGTGSGRLVKVNSDNALVVSSIIQTEQHWEALKNSRAYQTWGTVSLSPGTVNCLYIEPTITDLDLVVTYIRIQVIGASGGTSFPNVSNYFDVLPKRPFSYTFQFMFLIRQASNSEFWTLIQTSLFCGLTIR